MKMRIHSDENETHFHMNGFAPGLTLIGRLKATPKLAVLYVKDIYPSGRSVLGKNLPEVLSTAQGRRPRAVLKSVRTDQRRQITCIFFSSGLL